MSQEVYNGICSDHASHADNVISNTLDVLGKYFTGEKVSVLHTEIHPTIHGRRHQRSKTVGCILEVVRSDISSHRIFLKDAKNNIFVHNKNAVSKL